VLGDSGIFIDSTEPVAAAARIAATLSSTGWRALHVALAQTNLTRWNALAGGDRDAVIGLIAGIAGLGSPADSHATTTVS